MTVQLPVVSRRGTYSDIPVPSVAPTPAAEQHEVHRQRGGDHELCIGGRCARDREGMIGREIDLEVGGVGAPEIGTSREIPRLRRYSHLPADEFARITAAQPEDRRLRAVAVYGGTRYVGNPVVRTPLATFTTCSFHSGEVISTSGGIFAAAGVSGSLISSFTESLTLARP